MRKLAKNFIKQKQKLALLALRSNPNMLNALKTLIQQKVLENVNITTSIDSIIGFSFHEKPSDSRVPIAFLETINEDSSLLRVGFWDAHWKSQTILKQGSFKEVINDLKYAIDKVKTLMESFVPLKKEKFPEFSSSQVVKDFFKEIEEI